MRRTHRQPIQPLVRIRALTQELVAGITGACIHIRTLDDIAVDVLAGELLICTGTPGCGDDALLNVLLGDRRGVKGDCDVHTNARVQRATVSVAQATAIVDAWSSVATANSTITTRVAEPSVAPVLLLDLATNPDGLNARVASALLRAHEPVRQWVHGLRQQGGAVVLAAGNALHEVCRAQHHPSVRIISLKHGRIIAAPAPSARQSTFKRTFNSRSRHSGAPSADLQSAHACQSFASSIRSRDK